MAQPVSVAASGSPASESSRPVYPLQEIQAAIGGEIVGDAQTLIVGVNSLDLARPDELAFAEHLRYVPAVRQSHAGAIMVSPTFPAMPGRTLWRIDNPRLAFTKAMYLFQPPTMGHRGISRHAIVAPDAQLAEGVTIQECAVIRSRARIGRDTIIESGVHVGEEVVIGEQCVIGPNVVIRRGCRIGHRVIIHGGTVIGADGFGYIWHEGRHLKVPQLGTVIIQDDVELGANVCVDRAALGATIIQRGTKIDNLVQIAHNDVIGNDVILSGQVGLAGSVKIGDRAVLGGQVGVADHLTIGSDARIGAGSGVIKDVRPGETVWWFPARPIQRVKQELASLTFLPRLMKRLSRPPSKRRAIRHPRSS